MTGALGLGARGRPVALRVVKAHLLPRRQVPRGEDADAVVARDLSRWSVTKQIKHGREHANHKRRKEAIAAPLKKKHQVDREKAECAPGGGRQRVQCELVVGFLELANA